MMTCLEIQERMDAFLDRELDEREGMEVGRHLDNCARCRSEERAILELKETLRSQTLPPLPVAALAAIREKTVDRPGWRNSSQIRWFWTPAVIGLAAAVGAWFFSKSQRVVPATAPFEIAGALSVEASTAAIPSAPPVALHREGVALTRDLQ